MNKEVLVCRQGFFFYYWNQFILLQNRVSVAWSNQTATLHTHTRARTQNDEMLINVITTEHNVTCCHTSTLIPGCSLATGVMLISSFLFGRFSSLPHFLPAGFFVFRKECVVQTTDINSMICVTSPSFHRCPTAVQNCEYEPDEQSCPSEARE